VTNTADEARRLPALDYIKAIAIAAVMVTHASPFLNDPRLTDLDRFATALTSFQIPAFLLVSGFLSEKGMPLGWRFVARRLVRIIPPYVIASGVACGFGFWKPNSLRRVIFGLVFGTAIGIYYYIPVLVFCTLLVPLLSRLGTRTLIAATALLAVYAEAAWTNPGLRWTTDFYWGARDPFAQFHLGHFLIGMIAARRLADLARWQARSPLLVRALAVAAIVPFVWIASTLSWTAYRPILHTPYMLGVVALIASLTPARPAPAAIRFVSDATLTIYLYHYMLHPLLISWGLATMSPGLRIVVVSTASLAASVLFVLAARRLLGPQRSRVLIGA
jgi:peptidoglycan/LPS O-acetylase OafA/YrhL